MGGWPSLYRRPVEWRQLISIEHLYAKQVAKYRGDQLFKCTVQPDDKNSTNNVILVRSPT